MLVSSGAIAAGLAPLGLRRRPKDLARQQAAASVGQGLLVARYTASCARYGIRVGQVLLTSDDMSRRAHHRNASRTLDKLLAMGALPVVNENDTVATTEIRFGDNDRLAALVAHLVHADLLLLLSDVDGLYDGDPSRDGATLLGEVSTEADLDAVRVGRSGGAGIGTGGMQTKVEAARIATGAGIPVVLTSADHATEPKGRLVLDAGAVKALTERRASLLPAGITAVEGTFVGGDPVDLVGPDHVAVARGLVNFDSDELPALLGRSTRDLARELGATYEREVVHRDALVLLSRV